MEAAKAASQAFDPLEMDRFTRFQELTRMMAESVNDVATVQRSLQRSLQATEDELAAQARLTRELQDDLLRTRMVEFESMADRLYRVVRQAAKESGKQVRLDIVGGSIEVDRGVLDRMTGLSSTCCAMAWRTASKSREARTAAGKDATGTITISLTQEGNEVGGGVPRRRRRAGPGAHPRTRAGAAACSRPMRMRRDAELANMIFMPGFSTAESVTELAGRGVGMDVVRSEVNAMGGRIETATAAARAPSSAGAAADHRGDAGGDAALRRAERGRAVHAGRNGASASPARKSSRPMPAASSRWATQCCPSSGWARCCRPAGAAARRGRAQPVVIIRSAAQRVAVHVDEVLGNQEVVVKNLGPQLARLPGLAGMTLLPSGAVALIYNPVALATLYGDDARERMAAPCAGGAAQPAAPAAADGACRRWCWWWTIRSPCAV